jgi:acetoin utilization deacetylase AcuC-like enzyme
MENHYMLKRTGVFFHYQDGERLRDFPNALAGILDRDNVFLYDAFYPLKPPSAFELEPISENVLRQTHAPEMVEEVKRTQAFQGAVFSAAGTVAAAIRIWQSEIDNAFVFTGYGDHHAGTNSYGGGCYFNGAAMAIRELRQHFGAKRLAIIDTDAHHGDGTWEIFQNDTETLYMCFCAGSYPEVNNNTNVRVPWSTNDEDYLELIEEHFSPRVRAFEPQAIFWNWGYDGTQGDYGNIGITPEAHIRLARILRRTADQVCRGRLIVVLCGGSRRDLARYLIPSIIRVLAGQDQAR